MENNQKAIQWYPGHMAKARRQMLENIKNVDAVLQVVDSRIPVSSSNPDFDEMFHNKVRMTVLNKSDIADPAITRKWLAYYKANGMHAISINATNKGQKKILIDFLTNSVKEKIERSKKRGYRKSIRLMVVGIPNSGKSTVINMLAPKASAKTSNRPGVTRGQQVVRINEDIELVDTPGVLWPKFEDDRVGLHLAATGGIKDDVLDKYNLVLRLINDILDKYPNVIGTRFDVETNDKSTDEILEEISKKRSLLLSGGRVDVLRGCVMILKEFRAAKFGRLSLESPDD